MTRAETPYGSQPDTAFWKRAVSHVPCQDVDPACHFPLKLSRDQKIATAGSCFAQHLARFIKDAGYHHFVTEPGHPILGAQISSRYGYGVYSARFGNIYTARQLRQLIERAYGRFVPVEDEWRLGDRRWIDPFRPTIQPNGFATRKELVLDRTSHLKAVRRLFEECDVFIFTLGLTETWASKSDGAVFPLCPGVKGGAFDRSRYDFINLSVVDVVSDLTSFFRQLREINPRCSAILTVSPIPLIATATSDHVLVATTYSKAVLRVAVEDVQRNLENVHYFPSYEIIAGHHHRGQYFGPDCRDVNEAGIRHVMKMFSRHAMHGEAASPGDRMPDRETSLSVKHSEDSKRLTSILCDEDLLDE